MAYYASLGYCVDLSSLFLDKKKQDKRPRRRRRRRTRQQKERGQKQRERKKMFFDLARKSNALAEEQAIELHNEIFFWLIFIFIPVLVIFTKILVKSNNIWNNPTIVGIRKRQLNIFYFKLVHGTILEIIWTITPTIILILIALSI